MEIKNFKMIDKGYLKCAFTLHRNLIDADDGSKFTERNECAYFEKGTTRWINVDAKVYENRDGSKKTFNMCGWDPEYTKKILHQITERIRSGRYEVKENYCIKVDAADEIPYQNV